MAMEQNLRPVLIIATLFHYIGHLAVATGLSLTDDRIDNRHEAAGLEILARPLNVE